MFQTKDENVKKLNLTSIQQAYLIGSLSSSMLGGVDCQGYIEVELGSISEDEFKTYWNKVIYKHSMLRSKLDNGKIIISETKNFNEQILTTIDLTNMDCESKEKEVNKLRIQMENIEYKKLNIPYIVKLIKEDDTITLALSINLIFIDFQSVQIVLEELAMLINGQKMLDNENDYKLLLNKPRCYDDLKKDNDVIYWESQNLENINMFDSKEWAIKKESPKIENFYRTSFSLSKTESEKIKKMSMKMNMSVSSLFLSAYSFILHIWGKRNKNVINIPISNRNKFSSNYNNLVSEFTDVSLLYTECTKDMTFKRFSTDVFTKLIDNLDYSSYSCLDLIRRINKEKEEPIIYPFVFTGVLKSKGDYKIRYGSSKTPQVLIDCQVIENQAKEILISWDYRNCFSEKSIIENNFKFYCNLLLELLNNEKLWDMTFKEIEERLYFIGSKIDYLNIINIPDFMNSLEKHIENEILTDNIKEININEFNYMLKESILNEIMQNFKSNGLFCNKTETFRSICKKIEVYDENKRGLVSVLNLLYENGFLQKRDNIFIDSNKNSNFTIDALKKRSDFKNLSSDVTLKYIQANTSNFTSILSGKISSLNLLFPMGKQDLAKAFYSETIIYKYLNKMVAGVTKYIIENRTHSNILEVGGGTGVTTEYILKEIFDLPKNKYKYKFTDKSRFFINQIDIKNIERGMLDLDLDIKEAELYDIIIAVGVLNNVVNIKVTLDNLYKILSDDGIIIIVEPIDEHIEINATQAFLMPNHTDSRKDNNNCFFTEEEWKEIFKNNNFSLISSKPSFDSWFNSFQQKLFIIKKDQIFGNLKARKL